MNYYLRLISSFCLNSATQHTRRSTRQHTKKSVIQATKKNVMNLDMDTTRIIIANLSPSSTAANTQSR